MAPCMLRLHTLGNPPPINYQKRAFMGRPPAADARLQPRQQADVQAAAGLHPHHMRWPVLGPCLRLLRLAQWRDGLGGKVALSNALSCHPVEQQVLAIELLAHHPAGCKRAVDGRAEMWRQAAN